MTMASTILNDFTAILGTQPDGCDQARIGHCQESPNIVARCRAATDAWLEGKGRVIVRP